LVFCFFDRPQNGTLCFGDVDFKPFTSQDVTL
jgi:hypothetical protein